ncbi:putative related to tol protein [Rosellinia necatrix]|uniref:Putative related to tol protein n=1 Tax=Rosellinia necatrix TaxID=77044 RepID=A0A1W2TE60_ROSNE|nr:putative related to tol protein [Rosellinia necatrix]
MDLGDDPCCHVCYNLERKLARKAGYYRNGHGGPFAKYQTIKEPDDEPVRIYLNGDRVRAQSGKCIFCAIMAHVSVADGPFTLRLSPGRTPTIEQGARRYEIYRPTGPTTASQLEVDSTALEVPGPPPSIQHIPERPEVSRAPTSERALAFIRACLATCDEAHGACRAGAPGPPPKRLVRVPGGGGDGPVRVVATPPRGFREPYAALSYCWGRGVHLKTTRANLRDMMAGGLERARLPAVISDAVRIAAALGFRYLWVDSLCIVQDDARDWDAESQRMCAIYAGARLTLAAASAESADVPLARRHRRHEPAVFRCRCRGGSSGGDGDGDLLLAAREECAGGFHADYLVKPEDLPGEPLHGRGWALQEAVLSTRVVFYTPAELQWRCLAARACECRVPLPPGSGPGAIAMTRAYLQQQRLMGRDDDDGGDGDGDGDGDGRGRREIFAGWDQIVERYTERLLTDPDDKLPALSGLAQLLWQTLLFPGPPPSPLPPPSPSPPLPSGPRSGYVAGLWADDLVRGMLWSPLHKPLPLPSGPNRTSPGTGEEEEEDAHYYRAPSFSWASVEGPVTWRWRRSQEYYGASTAAYVETARVVDSWSHARGASPYGRLAAAAGSAGVVLRAPLIEHCSMSPGLSPKKEEEEEEGAHAPLWTLREIDPVLDRLELDAEFMELFPVADGSTLAGERGEGPGGAAPRWSVRRSRRGGVRSARGFSEGVAVGDVSLLMMAQNVESQFFLVLGVSPSNPAAYERLGMVRGGRQGISDVGRTRGWDLVKLSKETLLHGSVAELDDDMEWTGRAGVARMRTVTIV